MKRYRRMEISCSLLLMLAATPALAQDDPPEQKPETATEEVKKQTTRDTLRISYPFKFSKESTYFDWVNQRADTLEAAADVAPGIPRRIELLLAAANRLLASGTEHAASTRILGIEQDEMPDLEALFSLFGRVEGLFDRVGRLLKQHDEAQAEGDAKKQTEAAKQNEATKQVWRELAVRRDTIRSFAQALQPFLFDTGSDDDARNKRRAASKLSMLLESDSAEIAASARLWQALLRSKEQDPSRALSIIGPVTTPPRVGSQPYRFFGAILRAQLLAKHRSPTLALAMLMRVEELVETWFSGQRDRGHALRTSAFVRVAIMQVWAQALTQKEGYEDEVAWCQAGILTLQEDWLTGDMPRLLRLSPAIPLLVALEDLGVDDPKPAEKQPEDQ